MYLNKNCSAYWIEDMKVSLFICHIIKIFLILLKVSIIFVIVVVLRFICRNPSIHSYALIILCSGRRSRHVNPLFFEKVVLFRHLNGNIISLISFGIRLQLKWVS